MKAYPGGFISLTGANTSSELRARSIGKAHPDEEDTYEMSVSKEGSPIELLRKRMVNFPNRKMFRTSTPVLKELSTIWPAFEAGSQERFYVPCPYCNPRGVDEEFMFWIQWDNIKWSKKLESISGLPTEIFLECPNCAGKIDEGEHKTWMLDTGDWFSEKFGDRKRIGDVLKPSFHISSLYSPLGFFSWRDAVGEWFEYDRTKDVNKLQVHINQTLAELFHLQGSEISFSYLESRRESYTGNLGDWDVPTGVYCLTAGVDIQDDRIEVEVVGWGGLDETWSIDYVVLPGDTALMGDRSGLLADGQPSVWKLLHDYLVTKRWKHECGVEMPVEVTMIDTGHMTDQVHTFCRFREGNRIFPIKGDDGQGKGHFDRSKKRHEKYGTVLYWAHTFHLKNTLYHRLKLTEPGPGYCHFPLKDKYGKKYFQGLTCERLVSKMVNGRQVLKWETPSGARNEPIDCRNYATVAREVYPIDIESRARNGLHTVFPDSGTAGGIATHRPKRRKAKENSWL
jgi:phage terminase large subunit GpA-like protein